MKNYCSIKVLRQWHRLANALADMHTEGMLPDSGQYRSQRAHYLRAARAQFPTRDCGISWTF